MFVSILALVIIRLSRTMRSLKHLLEPVGELCERGVDLASFGELCERGVDLASSCSTSTPPCRPGG